MALREAEWRGIFWAGLLAGTASALPGVQMVNCFCCGWAWIAGAIAVGLAGRVDPGVLTEHRGAPLGARAGLYAGLVMGTLELIGDLLWGWTEVREETMGTYLPEQVPEAVRESLQQALSSTYAGITLTLVSTLMAMIIFALFGALGGLLYARLAGGKTPAPPEVMLRRPPTS
jgi:hypothetical protein